MAAEFTEEIKPEELEYERGYSGERLSEALPNAVPRSNINPKRCPYGLYAEQLSGTSFTTPRTHLKRTWTYRILPSCKHLPPVRIDKRLLVSDFSQGVIEPKQLRWNPLPLPTEDEEVDFIEGLTTYAGSGSAETQCGLAIHLYACNKSMENKAFCNSDGDFLIVPEMGSLLVYTEMGRMHVNPREICIVPRGIKFSVHVEGDTRGYVCETWGSHFVIPDLGPIGANGLANPRDFKIPNAWYENTDDSWVVVQKFCGELFAMELDHSPFDVVGWCGNYYPVKYCLDDFVAINSVTVDHIDPSIFTVLTCQSERPGVALLDFVIFPPRWSVHENTFRPPYYHRNCMAEFMGNICGKYEAKEEGFLPGGASLHSPMMGHGPDKGCFDKFTNLEDAPTKTPSDAMAFMFETFTTLRLTDFAANNLIQENYYTCWQDLEKNFDASNITQSML